MAKNPWIAGSLSFIVAGLGQLYNGDIAKCGLYLILEVLTAMVYLHASQPVGAFLNISVSAASMVDAYVSARRKNAHNSEIAKEPEKTPFVKVY
jgi:TM2 domain-containing membrane protein YozV